MKTRGGGIDDPRLESRGGRAVIAAPTKTEKGCKVGDGRRPGCEVQDGGGLELHAVAGRHALGVLCRCIGEFDADCAEDLKLVLVDWIHRIEGGPVPVGVSLPIIKQDVNGDLGRDKGGVANALCLKAKDKDGEGGADEALSVVVEGDAAIDDKRRGTNLVANTLIVARPIANKRENWDEVATGNGGVVADCVLEGGSCELVFFILTNDCLDDWGDCLSKPLGGLALGVV